MAGPREKGENTKWFSGNGQTAYVVTVIFLFNPLLGAPVEKEFFGVDRNKIGEAPRYLKICHKSDQRLDKCIRSSLKKFMEVVISGTGHNASRATYALQLNLPSLDPIELPSLEFQLGSGNLSLHMTFRDFKIKGFKNFTVTSVKSNLIDNKFEISAENPLLVMAAQFSAQGGIYTFPIMGRGNFYLNLTDVSAVFIYHLKTVNLFSGLKFFAVEDCLMDMLSSDINGHFGEYVDGSYAIGAAFNTFFNNNAHEIFTMIKPKISSTLSGIFESIANEILSRHPKDVLLPD